MKDKFQILNLPVRSCANGYHVLPVIITERRGVKPVKTNAPRRKPLITQSADIPSDHRTFIRRRRIHHVIVEAESDKTSQPVHTGSAKEPTSVDHDPRSVPF